MLVDKTYKIKIKSRLAKPNEVYLELILYFVLKFKTNKKIKNLFFQLGKDNQEFAWECY